MEAVVANIPRSRARIYDAFAPLVPSPPSVPDSGQLLGRHRNPLLSVVAFSPLVSERFQKQPLASTPQARTPTARVGSPFLSSELRVERTGKMTAPIRKVQLENIPVNPGMTKEYAPGFHPRSDRPLFLSYLETILTPSLFCHPQRHRGVVQAIRCRREHAQRHPS